MNLRTLFRTFYVERSTVAAFSQRAHPRTDVDVRANAISRGWLGRAGVISALAAFLGLATARTVVGATHDATASSQPDDWVDVSHSLGFPLGGLGTGYSAFGKFGFVKVNFDGRPTDKLGAGLWEYTQEPAEKSRYGFLVVDGDQRLALQSTPASWSADAPPVEEVRAEALLPLGRTSYRTSKSSLKIDVLAFSPLIAHDLDASTTPVQVFEVTVENPRPEPRSVTIELMNGEAGEPAGNGVVFKSERGQLGFAADDGAASAKSVSVELSLLPLERQTARFYIAWHYPKFDGEQRYYTRSFKSARDVLDRAQRDAATWKQRIVAWHESIDAPRYLRRMWFSSLSSVMTSTAMTATPHFYEIETPHTSLNTMDVSLYSNWAYMVNWPELERMDLDQYFKAMPLDGPRKGLVWHSLWRDAAKYVEEPGFLCRFFRAHLWFNDDAWSNKGLPYAQLAAERVFTEGTYRDLVDSKHGNQSYDIWRMPGVSSYVNSSWLYGLYGLERVARHLGEPEPRLDGRPVSAVRASATAAYDELLWNPSTRCWNLFHRTEGANASSTPDSVFSDQLFGKWVLTIDPAAEAVLPADKVRTALKTIYTHNRVEDPTQAFRGWCNGMLPSGKPDVTTGYHAKTFWLGPQINLASLLAVDGDEAASLDVMRSIESSLKNDLLAAGEWNRSLDKDKRVIVLREETEKDTPRFAPYPRYKSCWEWLPRVLGMQMDERAIYLNPFKTIPLKLKEAKLAGMTLTVSVEPGWTRARVDGKPVELPVRLDRSKRACHVEFVP
jgi:uncharacterized protein (DUF608 family)